MKKKTIGAILSITILSIGLLTSGCGSNKDADITITESETTTETQTETETETETAAKAKMVVETEVIKVDINTELNIQENVIKEINGDYDVRFVQFTIVEPEVIEESEEVTESETVAETETTDESETVAETETTDESETESETEEVKEILVVTKNEDGKDLNGVPDMTVMFTEAGTYEVEIIVTYKNDTVSIETVTFDVIGTLDIYTAGIKDLQIEVNSTDIDFMAGITYNDEYVKEITVDTSQVDLTKAGTYTVIYTITGIDGVTIIEVTVEVVVLTPEESQAAADKGEVVTTTGNSTKTDSNGNTPVAPETAAPAGNTSSNTSNTSNTGSTNNNTGNTGNTGNTTGGTGTTGNTNSGSTGSTSNTTTTTPSTPAAHTHSWTAHYATRTVTAAYDEPVYDTRIVTAAYDEPVYATRDIYETRKIGGYDKETNVDIDAKWAAYSGDLSWADWCAEHRVSFITKDVKVGTEQYIVSYKHHDAVTEQYIASYKNHPAVTEQYIDYYTCSCGATK